MTKRKPFALRIDADVLEAVQRYADDELRSLNAQIEYLLRAALREAGRTPAGTTEKPARSAGSDSARKDSESSE